MHPFSKITTILATSCTLYGCSHAAPGASPATEPGMYAAERALHAEDPGVQKPVAISRAVAVLQPTQGNHATGIVTLTERSDGGGLVVQAEFTGLPEGKHAYHIHQFGDCSGAEGKTAGPHFHFTGSSESKEPQIITGNLGELEAAADGTATAQASLQNATLQGPYSIIGRGIIVHAKPNDPTQPPLGAAGAPIACGVIGVANR